MNLVASEYVACQEARHGVLVLSEFTGAATFMQQGSLLFNPSNANGLSDALYDALIMEKEGRKKMHEELQSFVTTNTRLVVSVSFFLFLTLPSSQVPRLLREIRQF